MKRLAILTATALFFLFPSTVAAAECQFVLGFKTIRDLIGHETVGECLESEHHNEIGDSVQQTTGGLMVWRKADNWTAFTDGYRTWVNGPNGLEQRLNIERFLWEAENMIAALPINPEDSILIENLRQLAQTSSPVFLALLERSGGEPPNGNTVGDVLSLSEADSSLALQLLQMPFTGTLNQGADYAVFAYADRLAGSDLNALRRILSEPELSGGITDDEIVPFVLLVLAELRPQAAAAIQSLPWIQDGIGRRPIHNAAATGEDPIVLEEGAALGLAITAFASQEMGVILARKAWLQDSLAFWEDQAITRLYSFVNRDVISARQLLNMPFLESVSAEDKRTMDTLDGLYWSNRDGLRALLAHPELSGGITDSHHDLVQSLAR